MIAVVITPRGKAAEAIVEQLLPHPIAVVSGLRVYHFFHVVGEAIEPFTFRDFDGTPLTEYRTFSTLEAAKAWVSDDADRRHPC